jgi:predicted DNA-binding transcriptional regulator AlpA
MPAHTRQLSLSHLPPRGLSRVQTAAYIGVSPSLFDGMVRDGRMPEPRCINARLVWDRFEVDAAFAELPHRAATSGEDVWSFAP